MSDQAQVRGTVMWVDDKEIWVKYDKPLRFYTKEHGFRVIFCGSISADYEGLQYGDKVLCVVRQPDYDNDEPLVSIHPKNLIKSVK